MIFCPARLRAQAQDSLLQYRYGPRKCRDRITAFACPCVQTSSSQIELRRGEKFLLDALLITDDDAVVPHFASMRPANKRL
jgi:hypothetical protein